MHRVDLGEVAAQRPTRAHLDAPDRVRRPGRLGQRGVTRRLATLLLACQHYGEGRGKEGRKEGRKEGLLSVIISKSNNINSSLSHRGLGRRLFK